MSDIKVKRSADGIIMTVHEDVLCAFTGSGWEVYVEQDVETAKPEIAVSEPAEKVAEQASAEAKKTSTRGRKKAVRG